MAAAAAILSRGFLEADEITHYLIARSVWNDWSLHLLSIWGRMGCSALYAIPALLGVTASRLTAVAVTALTCFGTSKLLAIFLPVDAQHSWIKRHATAFAWLFLFAQPCFTMNSFTVMTEMLLACCWVWAAYVLLTHGNGTARRHDAGILAASLLVGLGGLMRPEGWIAIAAFPFFLFLWLRITRSEQSPSLRLLLIATAAAGAPSLFWYILGATSYHDLLWVAHKWPWSPKSQYGSRTAQFFEGALISMAIWLWIPITAAVVRLVKSLNPGSKSSASPSTTRSRYLALYAILFLVAPLIGFFFLHGFLGSFGLFGSMALPRYFICVAPMAAILAVLGMIQFETASRRPRLSSFSMTTAIRTLAVIGPLFTLAILASLGQLPCWPSQSIVSMDVVVSEVEHRVPPSEYTTRLIIAHPYAIMRLGLPLGTPADIRSTDAWSIEHAEPGTLLILEPQLWTNEGRPSFEQLISWGWQEDEEVTQKANAARPPIRFPFTFNSKGQARLWLKTR